MLFCKKKLAPAVIINKEAPRIGNPYDRPKAPSVFYRNDPEMNALIGGYSKGPEDSYAKELIEKYPLRNE